MSDENKNLGEQAEDALENAKDKAGEMANEAKEKASEFADKAGEKYDEAKEKASEFADEAKEAASDFADEAKKTANEFTESAKEVFSNAGGENKKILAGILAILLGALGVHKFILGYQKEGFILLGITIAAYALSCLGIGLLFIWVPGLIGLIEGIVYLTKSDEEFYNTYQVGKKPWF
ncbi:MAG: NINE protein [Flavobacteriaceae bacterium]